MTADTKTEIREMLGQVPGFFENLPGPLLDSEWESFKSIELSDQTAIPNKYKELIGIAVSGATRCRYCVYFHTEAARLFGATDEEINEAGLMAKHTMGWSTYLNAIQYDYDRFADEVNQITAYISKQVAAPA
jgi:AhpD family alkylhydroperoxidase